MIIRNLARSSTITIQKHVKTMYFMVFLKGLQEAVLAYSIKVVAIIYTSKILNESFISKGWIHIKTDILRITILSMFSKKIK